MKSRNRWIGIVLLLMGGGIPLLGSFIYHFYFLFPNSNSLFQWRHHWFDHLEFHTDQWTYLPGDSVQLFISNSQEDSVQARLYSPLTFEEIILEESFEATYQAAPAKASVLGTNWEISHFLPLPPTLSTGWYVIEVKNQNFIQRTSIFISPPPDFRKHEVAIIFSTNTWNAYNHWGGQSLYSRNHTPSISFDRPQLMADPFLPNTYVNHQLFFQGANRDLHLAELLDSSGIAFDAYSMEELEIGDERLSQYSVLIFSTHTEYWSWNMVHHLNSCLDSGASALFLAGNVAAYVTEFDTEERQISINPTRAREGFWQVADTGFVRPFGTQYSYFGFQTYSPFQVINDTSIFWQGTGVEEGDLLGEISEAYDFTPMYKQWWKNLFGLRKKGNYGAASGLEIDKTYEGTPENWVPLASGLNSLRPPGHGEVYPDPSREWNLGEGAEMGYYQHAGGGIVFHASSMAFTGALPHDARLRTLILNLIRSQLP